MKEQLSIKLNIHLEVSTQKVVKIKAHKRIVNGKTVKVCSLYRVIYAPWSFSATMEHNVISQDANSV